MTRTIVLVVVLAAATLCGGAVIAIATGLAQPDALGTGLARLLLYPFTGN